LHLSSAFTTCKISILGSFDTVWADYLGDMLLNAEVQEGQIRTTTLIGQPSDISAFIGMLNLLVDLGFPVIAVEYQQTALLEAAV
jgi:hypothetical protein